VAERTFFGTLRVAILLAVLAFVALGAWLDRSRSTDWDAPLRVTVYPIAAGDETALRSHVAALTADDFSAVASFFAAEARRKLVARIRLRMHGGSTSVHSMWGRQCRFRM